MHINFAKESRLRNVNHIVINEVVLTMQKAATSRLQASERAMLNNVKPLLMASLKDRIAASKVGR